MLDQDVFNQLWPKACEILQLLHVPAEAYVLTGRFDIREYRSSKDENFTVFGFTSGYNHVPQEVHIAYQMTRHGNMSFIIEVMCELLRETRNDGTTHATLAICVTHHLIEVSAGSLNFYHPYKPSEDGIPMHKWLAGGMFSPMMCRTISCLFEAKPETSLKPKAA